MEAVLAEESKRVVFNLGYFVANLEREFISKFV